MVVKVIFIPTNIKLYLLRQGHKLFLNMNAVSFFFGIKLNLNKDYLSINRNCNSIAIKTCLNGAPIDNISSFLKSWNIFFIKKIKFNGKGFKIVKKKHSNFLKLFFGRSHITWFLFRKISLMKLKKRKLLVLGSSKTKYNNTIARLVQIKYINLYTKRGLRVSRQLYYRRNSKKSAYK